MGDDTPHLVWRAGESYLSLADSNGTLAEIQRVDVSIRPRASFPPLPVWSAMGAKPHQPGVRSGLPERLTTHFLHLRPVQPSVASSRDTAAFALKRLLYGCSLFGDTHPGRGLISLPGGALTTSGHQAALQADLTSTPPIARARQYLLVRTRLVL